MSTISNYVFIYLFIYNRTSSVTLTSLSLVPYDILTVLLSLQTFQNSQLSEAKTNTSAQMEGPLQRLLINSLPYVLLVVITLSVVKRISLTIVYMTTNQSTVLLVLMRTSNIPLVAFFFLLFMLINIIQAQTLVSSATVV